MRKILNPPADGLHQERAGSTQSPKEAIGDVTEVSRALSVSRTRLTSWLGRFKFVDLFALPVQTSSSPHLADRGGISYQDEAPMSVHVCMFRS